MIRLYLIILFSFSFTNSSFAYLGPGMGAGLIMTALGVIVAIFVGLFGLIWFPVKRFIKKRKEKKNKID